MNSASVLLLDDFICTSTSFSNSLSGTCPSVLRQNHNVGPILIVKLLPIQSLRFSVFFLFKPLILNINGLVEGNNYRKRETPYFIMFHENLLVSCSFSLKSNLLTSSLFSQFARAALNLPQCLMVSSSEVDI